MKFLEYKVLITQIWNSMDKFNNTLDIAEKKNW